MVEEASEWVTWSRRIPRSFLPVLLQSERLAMDHLRLHGRLPNSPAAAQIEVLEVIFATYLITASTDPSYQALMMETDHYERREALEAFDRDGWRCLICGHTGMNQSPGGRLESHHIVPRGCHDERVLPANLHHRSNKASLCDLHHESITNPRSPTFHWRRIAPVLYRMIGNEEQAARVEATLTDPITDLLEDTL